MNPSSVLRALSPWSPAESVRALAVVLVGAGAVGLGWHRVVDEPSWDHQIGSVAIAGTGFVLVGFAAATWVLRGRHAVAARREALLPDVSAPAAPVAVDGDGTLVAHPTLGPYHRAGCPMAEGRDWPTVRLAVLERAGRRPCGVCRP